MSSTPIEIASQDQNPFSRRWSTRLGICTEHAPTLFIELCDLTGGWTSVAGAKRKAAVDGNMTERHCEKEILVAGSEADSGCATCLSSIGRCLCRAHGEQAIAR
jgi:hypothetical protein